MSKTPNHSWYLIKYVFERLRYIRCKTVVTDLYNVEKTKRFRDLVWTIRRKMEMTGCKLSGWNWKFRSQLYDWAYHPCILLLLPLPVQFIRRIIWLISFLIVLFRTSWMNIIYYISLWVNTSSFYCTWVHLNEEESAIVDESKFNSKLYKTFSISCFICRFVLKTCNIRHERISRKLEFVLKGFNSKRVAVILGESKWQIAHTNLIFVSNFLVLWEIRCVKPWNIVAVKIL